MARNLGDSPSLRPRTPSLFEPVASGNAPSPAAPAPRPGRTRALHEEPERIADQQETLVVEEQDARAATQFSQATRPARKGKRINPDLPGELSELSIDPQDSMLIDNGAHPGMTAPVRNSSHGARASSSAMSSLAGPTRDRDARELPENPSISPANLLTGRTEELPSAGQQKALPVTGKEQQTVRDPLIGRPANIVPNQMRESHDAVPVTPFTRRNQSTADGDVMPLRREERYAVKSAFPQPAAEPEPSIHVSIGRIEIRAERESPPQRKPERSSPVMSLDEYLRQKHTRVRQ
jgi:hypothetical protein